MTYNQFYVTHTDQNYHAAYKNVFMSLLCVFNHYLDVMPLIEIIQLVF